MVHYKLQYFDVRGRGEHIRYLFAHAGIPFEDVRVQMSEWAAIKPSKLVVCLFV
jgi:hypothetical protein